KKNSILSADRRMPLPKDELHQAFNSDSEVSKYLIPSQSVKSIQDINEFLDMYGTVVLKPVRSNRGRNVFIIRQHGSKYTLDINKNENTLSLEEFKRFYGDHINNKDFIVQKYIYSIDKHGHPIDCRIHVEKDGKGRWANPR